MSRNNTCTNMDKHGLSWYIRVPPSNENRIHRTIHAIHVNTLPKNIAGDTQSTLLNIPSQVPLVHERRALAEALSMASQPTNTPKSSTP